MNKSRLYVFTFSIALFGCSNNLSTDATIKDKVEVFNTENDANIVNAKNLQYLEGAYSKYINKSEIDNIFSAKRIQFFSAIPLSIDDTLSKISKQYGFDYVILDDMTSDGEKKDSKSDEILYKKRKVNFSGNLTDFITYLESLYNMKFDFKGGLLKGRYYQTKVVNLQQYFDGSDFSSSISIGKGTEGSLTGKSSLSLKSNSWQRIREFLSSALGKDGNFTVFEDYSIVTVKARPDKFALVDKFFEKIINESKMQLVVDYRIISINKSNLNQLGFSAQLNNTGKYSLSTATKATNDFLVSSKTGSLSGTIGDVSARLDAITKQLSQEVMHEGHFVGLPNRAIPLNLTTKMKYISSIEVTKDKETKEEVRSVKVSDLVTGFSMVLVPKILNDGRIQIMSGYSRKQLVSLDGVNGISLPVVDENESTSTVTMNSGDIRLVSLFKDKVVQKAQGAALISAGKGNETSERYIAVLVGVSSYKSNALMSTTKI